MHSNVLGSTAANVIGVVALILNGVRFPVTSIVTFARREKLEERALARSQRQDNVRIAALNKKQLKLPAATLPALNDAEMNLHF